MAGKWSKLKGKLPDAPAADMASAADPKFLEKVEAAKQTMVGLSLPGLMQELTELNKEWDDLKERQKELNVEFEAIGALLKAKFEEQDVTSMKNVSGETFYLHVEPHVNVKDRQEFERWVEADPDLDYLWGVHPASLNSLVKGYLEEGKDEQIPQCLNVFLKTSIRVRKGGS